MSRSAAASGKTSRRRQPVEAAARIAPVAEPVLLEALMPQPEPGDPATEAELEGAELEGAELALPEAALPEAALPEAALPEAALPEAALPEAEEPPSPVNYDDEGLGEVEIDGAIYRFDSGKQGTALCLSARRDGAWRWSYLGELRWDGRDLRSKALDRSLLTRLSASLRTLAEQAI